MKSKESSKESYRDRIMVSELIINFTHSTIFELECWLHVKLSANLVSKILRVTQNMSCLFF